jgi:hypothetical protein
MWFHVSSPNETSSRWAVRGIILLLGGVAIAGAFYAVERFGLDIGAPEPRDETAGQHAEPALRDLHFQPRPVTATSGNFLVNAGFEEGAAGWEWLDWSREWGPFSVEPGQAATGELAAHLAIHGGPADRATRVFGVVQEIASVKFPAQISGRYFVERWEPGGAQNAYVQVVIIAMLPRGGQPTVQLRYILDGVTVPPYNMSNARYAFVRHRATPEIGRWIDFSLDVRGDYQRLWGEVPPDGTGCRVLFEARYDDKPAGGSVDIDVWYDDLFVGIP